MRRNALAAILLLAALARGMAQEDGQDPFDASAFDQSVQQSAQEEKKAGLGAQFGGDFLFSTSATTTADFAGFAVGGTFSGKAFLKVEVPDYGAVYVGYNFLKNLYQGTGGSLPVPALSYSQGDLLGVTYALSELHFSFDIARIVFFRIGNQLLAWGPSLVWTPVDFVNLEHIDPLATLDLRVGKPGVRATLPMGISNLFLFADMSDTVTSGALTANDLLSTANLGARWDLTAGGFEMALTGYWGGSIQNKYGLDFSGRLLGFDVYGELAMAFPYGSYAFTYSYSLGFQRTLGDLGYWSIAGEYFYNDAGTADTSQYPSLVSAGSFSPFSVGRQYAYASVTRTHLFVDGVSLAAAGFADFSDGSFLVRASTSIDLPGAPPFTLAASYAGGGAGKAFTYYTGDNALTASLQVRFAF